MKVWIDTDIGGDIDDALALLYAMTVEDLEIIGVSTVFQNTLARAKIAKKLFDMASMTDVKVYAGIGQPIKATKVFNDPVDCITPPRTYIPALFDDAKIESTHAVDALRDALLSSHNDITVITLGALTNVASLITKYPEAAKKIQSLAIMGTAQWLNLNEFNISCDPEAADIVFRSDIHKTIVSLDVTFKCEVNKEQRELLKTCQSQLVKTVLSMNDLWGEGMILHDPLTLAEAINPKYVTFTPGNLKVELEGEFSRGKCVNLADFNWKRQPRADMLISTNVDHDAFTNDYVNKIYGLDKAIIDAKMIYMRRNPNGKGESK
jgi:purine nucleosidase/pyrimidine-specific ribonucleoside hydrolase